jgi:3-methyladenine DNA glycosylase AlkD
VTKGSAAIASEATRIIGELRAQARPAGDFDASRYFRTTTPLEFLNVRTAIVRALGKSTVRQHKEDWTAREALAFADRLIQEPHLEVKGVGIEALACFRTRFTPAMLPAWKRWLASDLAANWATTDSICGSLISPLLIAHPDLIRVVKGWTSHRNMWVRRAAAVSLVRLAARGVALDDAYAVATALRGDREDLVHKAAGWLLREAGRTDMARLERYLRTNGRSVPRTTIRYAIERFPAPKRRELLAATRLVPSNP